ncbi:heparin lyase I family protein [Motilimonas pumila]|uniref:Right handed beta helix domain-containing protein n=1 Tax=Motilimonas pumila TaxID=2303987 RepID=A0A418YAK1_9GAMM|nr:heparin lyase I family protein [Motilimonas pumila]RJG40002.1 hypothetical protein D1Z90_17875 [Motilimonas pumila]
MHNKKILAFSILTLFGCGESSDKQSQEAHEAHEGADTSIPLKQELSDPENIGEGSESPSKDPIINPPVTVPGADDGPERAPTFPITDAPATIAPVVATPTPAAVAPTPAAVAPTPAVVAPTPAVATPTPAVATPTPAVATPTPAVATPTPAVATPTPAVATPTPAVATPTPAVATPTPAVATPTPVITLPPAPSPTLAVTPDPIPDNTVFNVQDYGILPYDGEDDSLALRNLLNLLSAGDTVHFPSGEYIFESEVTFPYGFPNNIKFTADNDTFIAKVINPISQNFSGKALWNLEGVDNFSIQNFKFRGLNPYLDVDDQVVESDGLVISGSNNILVKDSEFYGFRDACIRILASDAVVPSQNVQISNNVFKHCSAVKVRSEGAASSSVKNLKIEKNYFLNVRVGIDLSPTDLSSNAVIIDNVFDTIKTDAIALQGFDSLTVEGNLIREAKAHAIHLMPSTLDDATQYGLFSIKNNAVLDSKNAIRIRTFEVSNVLNPVNRVEVTGNYFENIQLASIVSDYRQVIRLYPYATDFIDELVVKNNSYYKIDEAQGGEFINTSVANKATVKPDISGQKNQIKDEKSYVSLPTIDMPSITKSAVLFKVDWDRFYPRDYQYEVPYENNIEYSISRLNSPGYYRKGGYAAAFMLNDINDPKVNGSYRVEIKADIDKSTNPIRWYSFSTRLPGDYYASSGEESIFQVHTAPSDNDWARAMSLPYALTTFEGNFRFFVSKTHQDPVEKEYFDLGVYERNTWVDWVVQVHHDTQNGFIRVWKDGLQVVDYNGGVGYPLLDGAHNHWSYPKWGIYRWEWDKNPEITSRKVFFDQIKVGSEKANLAIMQP